MPAHVIVPYSATNSTVRARALHWIGRASASGRIDREQITVHGPGFAPARVPARTPVLLLRNARRVTRGRPETHLLTRASVGVYDLDDGLPWDDGHLPGLGHWTKRPFPRSRVARRAAGSRGHAGRRGAPAGRGRAAGSRARDDRPLDPRPDTGRRHHRRSDPRDDHDRPARPLTARRLGLPKPDPDVKACPPRGRGQGGVMTAM